jgi:hypothetical protein
MVTLLGALNVIPGSVEKFVNDPLTKFRLCHQLNEDQSALELGREGGPVQVGRQLKLLVPEQMVQHCPEKLRDSSSVDTAKLPLENCPSRARRLVALKI